MWKIYVQIYIYVYICISVSITIIRVCIYMWMYIYIYRLYQQLIMVIYIYKRIHPFLSLSLPLYICAYIHGHMYLYVCVQDWLVATASCKAKVANNRGLAGCRERSVVYPTSHLKSLGAMTDPKGPYTGHVRTLTKKTTPGMAFGARVLKWAVYGLFGPLGNRQHKPRSNPNARGRESETQLQAPPEC